MANQRQIRVLLAEDDLALQSVMVGLFEASGFDLTAASDGQQAWEHFEQRLNSKNEKPGPFDVVVADINMPKLDGHELITRIREVDKNLPVIFVTAYSSVDSAIEALRRGAYDYLTKPFRNDRLIQVVRNAAQTRVLVKENAALKQTIQRNFGFQDILKRSPGLSEVFEIVGQAAPTSASLLIRGETGTGKEIVARAIHHASERAKKPFMAVNCAALAEGLLESELFGHEKGAFSGAVASSPGLFRSANKGTLFLDELGEMPPSLQVKLLRVLESREVRPVGSAKSIAIDVRLIAATHKDLSAEVEAGRFRQDLYYRLAVIEIDLPALRERRQDILPLAQFFLKQLANDKRIKTPQLHEEVQRLLLRYDWPGNVRELRNVIEHALTLGGTKIQVANLPQRFRKATASLPERGIQAAEQTAEIFNLLELEKRHVFKVLDMVQDDRRKASELLGIDLSTLYRKLKRWGTENA